MTDSKKILKKIALVLLLILLGIEVCMEMRYSCDEAVVTSENTEAILRRVPEVEITAALLRLYHKLKADGGTILRTVLEQLRELRERELRTNRKISDIDKEIARLSEQNLVLVRLKSKGYVDPALYLSQQGEIEQKLRTLRRLRRRIMDSTGEDSQIQDTEIMLDCLEDGPQWLGEPSQELFESLVRRIVIVSADTLKFTLLNGLELTERIGKAVR